jgi:hypothetical protein
MGNLHTSLHQTGPATPSVFKKTKHSALNTLFNEANTIITEFQSICTIMDMSIKNPDQLTYTRSQKESTSLQLLEKAPQRLLELEEELEVIETKIQELGEFSKKKAVVLNLIFMYNYKQKIKDVAEGAKIISQDLKFITKVIKKENVRERLT